MQFLQPQQNQSLNLLLLLHTTPTTQIWRVGWERFILYCSQTRKWDRFTLAPLLLSTGSHAAWEVTLSGPASRNFLMVTAVTKMTDHQAVIDTSMALEVGGGGANCVSHSRSPHTSPALSLACHTKSATTSHARADTVCTWSHAGAVLSSTLGQAQTLWTSGMGVTGRRSGRRNQSWGGTLPGVGRTTCPYNL